MDTLFVFMLCILSAVCVVLCAALIVNKRKIQNLSQSIDQFLQNGTLTEFSAADGSFARLQNSICDLQTKLMSEQENTHTQTKRNSEFIADISHQLKTPLAGIRLYCEMEYETAPGNHMQKQLVLIEKMEKLIQNVLRLEKIRSDTYVMQFEEVSMETLCKELQTEFSALFPTGKITLSGNAVLRCDKTWMHEALGNVIKNACEHTRNNGCVEILIEKGEKSVSMTVEDDGGGVPAQELPLLFNRFHRAPDASPESTGIGLAITKAIVEKHHGIISATNGKKGLRVVMCFPVIDANLKL